MLAFFQAYLQSRISDEQGSVAAEYGLLIFLVALGIIAGATLLGDALDALFTQVANAL